MRYARLGLLLPNASSGAGAFAYEIGASLVDLVAKPTEGFKQDGAKGAAKGAAVGLGGLVLAPLNGIALFADRVAVGTYNRLHPGEKRKAPRWDARKLFRKQDVYGGGEDGVGEAVATGRHRPSLAPIVGVSMTPAEMAAVQTKLKTVIAAKEQVAQGDHTVVRRSSSVLDPTAVTIQQVSPPTPHRSLPAVNEAVPVSVRGLELSTNGEFHLDLTGDVSAPPMLAQAADFYPAFDAQAPAAKVPTLAIAVLSIGTTSKVEALLAVSKVLATDGHRV